ncbi:hypothetical protein CY34DRAFT_471084 [Suillus luteus UH-Slu-Lm8-n1]|uniref:Uncharacterized protein n=1 Tax=Suillus luteus UH-Slu-Lm8-n1 TaxID=930992 RepID=A0A0D0AZA6_9AGAM|nr:hypothetical protein CY34DRAFT_471084 [Suillus luteus UH-Slu-Lm8-n1]
MTDFLFKTLRQPRSRLECISGHAAELGKTHTTACSGCRNQAGTRPFTFFHDSLITRLKVLSQIQQTSLRGERKIFPEACGDVEIA